MLLKQKLNEKISVFFENKFRMLNSKKYIHFKMSANLKGQIGMIMQSFIILHYLEK